MKFSGDALRQLRLRRNMSRADLAVAIRHASSGQIKATERGIRGWEKNEYVPRGEAIPAIAAALTCEIGELYESSAAAEDAEAARLRRIAEQAAARGDYDTAEGIYGVLKQRAVSAKPPKRLERVGRVA